MLQIKNVISNSNFKKIIDADAVSELSEADEGLFGWIAANLLLGK